VLFDAALDELLHDGVHFFVRKHEIAITMPSLPCSGMQVGAKARGGLICTPSSVT